MKSDRSYGVIPVHIDDRGERRYLLVKHHAGHWGFPKGHADQRETPMEAARRELAEETGLRGVELQAEPTFDETYYFSKRDGHRVKKTVTYFVGLVSQTDVTPQEEEVADYAWGDQEQTMQRLTFKEGRRLLERVVGHLGKQEAGRSEGSA